MSATGEGAQYTDEARAIAARNVAFDWTRVPLHSRSTTRTGRGPQDGNGVFADAVLGFPGRQGKS